MNPSSTASASPLATLPLPEPHTLTDGQRRGATCVWDSTPLTATTAMDLGERQDDGASWFPRACRPCLLPHAVTALQQHTGCCEQCVDDFTQCPTGVGLVRLVREARR